MAPSTRKFSDQLAETIRTLPIFMRPQLAPILGDLHKWVDSVESRLTLIEGQQRAIDKMPSAESLAVLVSAPACICPAGASSQFCPVHKGAKCEDCVDG